MRLSDALKNSILEGAMKAIDANGPGRLVLIKGRDGPMISEHVLSHPCAKVSKGVLEFNSIEDDPSAREGGQPTWARIYDGSRRWVLDLKVGEEVAVGDVEKGQTVKILAGRLRA